MPAKLSQLFPLFPTLRALDPAGPQTLHRCPLAISPCLQLLLSPVSFIFLTTASVTVLSVQWLMERWLLSKAISFPFASLWHQLLLSFPALHLTSRLLDWVSVWNLLHPITGQALYSVCTVWQARGQTFCRWCKNPENQVYSPHFAVVETEGKPLSNLPKGLACLMA